MSEHTRIIIADIYWFGFWLLLGFGGFETYALASGHPEMTLSDTTWRGLDVLPGQTPLQWNLLHIIAAVALQIVVLHLVFRMWP